MKKLFTVSLLAGLLSMPSIVLAEASWYGSLRSGIELGGGSDARVFDGGSRWGIKGSSEASEGLTALYRFEHKISTTNAGQSGGRLAYVGLSGGFGTLTAGQIWNAAFNHAGAITDKANYYGDSGTGYRHGNALSYAHSAGSVSFQLDLIADGKQDTGGHIDKGEFGLTVGIGDLGKIAVAYTNQKNTLKTSPTTYTVARDDDDSETTPTVPTLAQMIMVTGPANSVNADGMLTAAGLQTVRKANDSYTAGTCDDDKSTATTTDDCTTVAAYVYSSTNVTTDADGRVNSVTTEEYFATATKGGGDSVTDVAGHKTTHVAFEFGLGGLTSWIGHSQSKVNGAANKSKTTHFGMSGGLGDTGMSFLVQARNVKGANGMNSNPWLFGMSRDLGGGAAVHFEHGNNDDGMSGKTRVGLHVGF